MYLIDYLGNNFEEKLDHFRSKLIISLEILLLYPLFIVQLNISYILNQKPKLDNEDISDVWYEIMSKFHSIKNFEEMPINRYNWVRHEHFIWMVMTLDISLHLYLRMIFIRKIKV